MTIANDLENPDPRQVVYTDFQIGSPYLGNGLGYEAEILCAKRYGIELFKTQPFEAGTRFDFQLRNSTAPKRLELGLRNFTWTWS